jgi:ubiquinone/menaquinone biosynthesis C-methylase UbiE
MPTSLLAAGYDVINAVIWLPTGIAHIRDEFVASLALRPGDKVLEVGCGTGAVTRRLLATGAHVTAIDRSSDMLDAARRRAPDADYRQCDVTSTELGDGFDCVVLAFVLHELPSEKRRSLLPDAARTLRAGGRVAVMEWALPSNATGRRVWGRIIRAIEPPHALELVEGSLTDELAEAGLTVTSTGRTAQGRVQMLTAAPSRVAC